MAVALRELERRVGRGRPALRVVTPPPAPRRPPRVVYWLRRALVLAVAIGLVAGVAVGVRSVSADGADGALVDMTVVVPAGGTLWDLAARYAPPEADRAAWVAAVAERNAIDPGAVQPGTAVTVPVEAPSVLAVPHGPDAR